MNRRYELVRIVATAAIGVLLASAGPARADLYRCTGDNGQQWIRNYKVPGEDCTLAMETGEGSSSESAEGSESSAAGGGDGGASDEERDDDEGSYRPPRVGGRVEEEPASLQARMERYRSYVEDAAERYELPVAFLDAVIRVESSFHYQAVSPAGARGLMQLMPATARRMNVEDPFNPRDNVMGGARFLRILANRHDGDMVEVLSSYHAGSGAVADKGGIPYDDTESYVRAVLDHYYRYKSQDPLAPSPDERESLASSEERGSNGESEPAGDAAGTERSSVKPAVPGGSAEAEGDPEPGEPATDD